MKNWQQHATGVALSLGCVRGKTNASTYYHPERNVAIVLHVDDFDMAGRDKDMAYLMEEFSCQLILKVYLIIKVGQSGKFLGREKVRLGDGLISIPDPGHVERVLEVLECTIVLRCTPQGAQNPIATTTRTRSPRLTARLTCGASAF